MADQGDNSKSAIPIISSSSTLTIRVIKSFPYRTCKNLVLRDLDLSSLTVGQLKQRVKNDIKTLPGWKPYIASVDTLDTLKLYNKAMGTKTMNLIINLDHDPEWVFDDDGETLAGVGCEHETEVSIFNGKAYEDYKANPEAKW